jgi:peptidoglycan/LPS O-acetylase OafA/YrhL
VTIALRPNPIAEPVAAQTIGTRIYRIWPAAVVAVGLTLTAVWTCFLGYWLIALISPFLPYEFSLHFLGY